MDNLDFYDLMEQDQHDPEVQYQLGLCYLYGYGTEINEQEAMRWLQLAAEQGHCNAMDLLGQSNDAVSDEAITDETLPVWCMKAEEGDPDAQYAVADYFARLNAQKYQTDISYYLSMAAEQGHGLACLHLGKQMMSAKDYKQAITYLDRAAECSIAEAADLLSFCYFHGLGVVQNKEIAEQFLQRNAEWGDGKAKLCLAVRYEVGNCVPVSHAKAMYYIALAQQAGLTDARAQFQAQVDAYHAEKAAEADRLVQEQRIREAQEWEAEQARLAQEAYQAKLAEEAEQARLAQERAEAKKKKQRRIRIAFAISVLLLAAIALRMVILSFKNRTVCYADFGQSSSVYNEPGGNHAVRDFLLFDVAGSNRKIAVFCDDISQPEGAASFYLSHAEKKGTVELTFSALYPQASAFLCNVSHDFDEYSWNIQLVDGSVQAEISNGLKQSSSITLNSTVPITANDWYTVALVDDGTSVSLYLDGVLQDSEEYCEKTAWFQKKHSFGDAHVSVFGRQNIQTEYSRFCGSMAEFSIYNYVRSEQQLQETAERATTLPMLTDSFYKESFLAKYEVARGQMGYWNGHYYYAFNFGTALPPEQAREYCESLGGHLATISSEAENTAVYQYIRGPFLDCEIYFGLLDTDGDGNWQWITGEPVEYLKWDPNVQNTGSYAYFSDRSADDAWYASSDIGNLYLCEWDEAPSDNIVKQIRNPLAPTFFTIEPMATTQWNGNTYGIFDLAMGWEEAQDLFSYKGGHLATISSQEENDMLYQFLRDNGHTSGYFGLTERDYEGNWKWVNDEPLIFTNWAPGEPSNENGEECYGMFYSGFSNGTWNDSVNDGGVFLCEWDHLE